MPIIPLQSMPLYKHNPKASDPRNPRSPARHRQVITAIRVLVLGAFLTACAVPDEGDAGEPLDTAQAAVTLPTGGVFRDLYVVAHEDDDLLFMNPDVPESIRAGH